MSFSRSITWLAGAGVAVALAFAVAVVAHADQRGPLSTPQGTVRSFLTDAVVDHDPVDACGYLTPRARKSFEPGQDCASLFASARLDGVISDRGLARLTYRVTADGSARVVHAGGRSFVLLPASPEALAEFHAPPTDWRIDSGIAGLAG
ncbi:hypothetical protein [Solirubrobacter soli]|uniref:hypothetical protein n=1 Tax=Solirubrobacter soli TaxID=363832 RepID=UPI00041E5DFD|nr:hypothetical protein [Solirubrobacter soli]